MQLFSNHRTGDARISSVNANRFVLFLTFGGENEDFTERQRCLDADHLNEHVAAGNGRRARQVFGGTVLERSRIPGA